MKITTQSPTRVDLAGGTLDCWPLYLLGPNCVTVNLSVSIFTHAELTPKTSPDIDIFIDDLKYERRFSNLQELLSCGDSQLDLLRFQLEFWQPCSGFSLRTRSESPIGGGLGGSSSLTISLLKAFSKWHDKKMTTDQYVELAHNLEAKILRKPTGTQDYFPALEPGLNAIHYTPQGAQLESLEVDAEEFKSQLSLVYTGQPHHSGLNNWQVIKSAMEGDKKVLQALEDIRVIAWDLYESVRKRNWKDLPQLFEREFEARIRLSKGFSSPEIERLHDVVLKSGGLAVKICGAGGGGCVIVWSPPSLKTQVERACQEAGFAVLNADPVVR